MTTADPDSTPDLTPAPGPAARSAFRLGVLVASVAGLTVLAWLYRTGTLTTTTAVYVTVALFPVYLLVVASVLSVWLGYDKGPTDLQSVYRSR
ncbi:hypothetical protein [Haloplanus pelagicus]|jgi:hypothetical protein|uniref:hypothetical protein n=1 Tax=Haloplanus pelagicus TaxID=2949995 RepID=UPI00203DE3BA|nr:hypothetical protein [Haloplanus sp. HW8-1]